METEEVETIERVFPIRLSILENSPYLQNIPQHGGKLSVIPIPDGDGTSVTCPTGSQAQAEAQSMTQGMAQGMAQDQPQPQAEQVDQDSSTTQTTPVVASPSHLPRSGPGFGPGDDGNELGRTNLEVPATPEIEMTDRSSSGEDPSNTESALLTNKFEYAMTESGVHGVIQGTRRAFTRCEDELIHIPGAIQSYGILVGMRRVADGILIPRIVSENSYDICHYQPAELFALDNFNQILPIFQRPAFNSKLREVRSSYEKDGKDQEPTVFDFSFSDPTGRLIPCWCACHYLGGDVDLYICEFELQDYSLHLLATPQQTDLRNPVDTLGSDHMDVATGSSLHSKSNPIFMGKSGILAQGLDPNLSSVELVSITTNIQRQLSAAVSVQGLLDVVVGIVYELSGFHRVMVYQFDQDFNGTVVAERMDSNASQDVYRGLHFPSTDIPPQARRLYMVNKVRVLFDRTQDTSRLVGRSGDDIAVPLDLSHAYLRAMSPVHLKYLANMAVRSSMSMSLEYEGNLWGLLVCHSYGPTATQVPFSIREMCYSIGITSSNCLEKILNSNKLQARRIIETLRDKSSPNDCITASSEELLKLFGADCGFLVVEGDARTIGRLSSYTEAVTLLRYLFFRKSRTILFSGSVNHDFTDLHYAPGFSSIAGVLYIPLSGNTDDCVVFYRKTQLKEVHWAGQPNLKSEFGTLEPRNSFKRWTEIVDGTSKNWTPEQGNIAAMAQLVYGSFIRVWREKESAVKESRLKRLLLHDASHQVRTPLNAVINYLEMALEKPLEESTKHALTRSYTASKSLIFVIDDLLNLTGNTTGTVAPVSDPFDLNSCLEEALDPLKRLAGEKDIEVITSLYSGTHRYFLGDSSSLQRAVSVLVENAIQHTCSGKLKVEWSELQIKKPKTILMRIAVTDFGPGLSERELDDMFQEFEQVPDEDFDESSDATMAPREKVLRVGVGLAFVARYVKQNSGQLKVTSTRGLGSTFAMEVPFVVASRAPSLASRRDASPLPVLPMPGPPAMDPGDGTTQVHGTTPSAASALQLSPPIVAPTPTISPMESANTSATPRLNILVADDNNVNIQILERRLSRLGHRVWIARDGQDCFNMFMQNQAIVDIVLMDLMMPVVSGYDSARLIREQEATHPLPSRAVQSCGRTPIFAVSGNLRRTDIENSAKAGFDGFIPKPIDMRRLATCISGALDQNSRRLEIYDPARFERGGWFIQQPTDETLAESSQEAVVDIQPDPATMLGSSTPKTPRAEFLSSPTPKTPRAEFLSSPTPKTPKAEFLSEVDVQSSAQSTTSVVEEQVVEMNREVDELAGQMNRELEEPVPEEEL